MIVVHDQAQMVTGAKITSDIREMARRTLVREKTGSASHGYGSTHVR